jgi:rubrerythrin
VAAHTERVLLLKDGRILKEKEGLHSAKKRLMCPHCGSTVQINDTTCPSCHKTLNT